MKKALFLLLVLAALPVTAQSVADAARASKDKSHATRVITNEDVPSASADALAASSTGSTPVSLDSTWDADIDRLKRAYRDICSNPEYRNGKAVSADIQRQLEEAGQPLRARLAKEEAELKVVRDEMDAIKRDAEAESAAIKAKGGKASPADMQRIEEIRVRLAEQLKSKQGVITDAMAHAGAVYKEIMGALSECTQTGK